MPVCEICKTKGVLTSYKNLVLHLLIFPRKSGHNEERMVS